MQAILYNCCGLDVHKDSVVACIVKSESENKDIVTKEIRVFRTFLNDLTSLREWLESEGCRHVAMESSGVYWYPVYDILETAFDGEIEILVTNARHMRNVPGKNRYKRC
jgi:transposase